MSLDQARQSITEIKRADVLTAALEHFLKHGYVRAAMADIARDADVSTATLYKYYASKKDLFTAVATKASQTVRDAAADIPDGATTDEIFTRLLVSYHEAQQTARVNDLLRTVIAEASAAPDLAREIFEAIIEMRYRNVKSFIDTMVERGVLVPHDTELGAKLGIGMIKELFVWPAMFDANFKLPQNALDMGREAIGVYLARYGTDGNRGTPGT